MSSNGADGSVLGNVEYAARLSADFKIKECPAFISTTGKQTKGPKVLCFNDADIPLTVDGFKDRKQINVGLVVVDCLSDGYTRVPYECTNNGVYKLGKNPMPLSERSAWTDDASGGGGGAAAAAGLSMLTCWPYGILEGCPKDKDDRNEEFKWEVCRLCFLSCMTMHSRQCPSCFSEGLFSRLRMHFHTRGAKCADDRCLQIHPGMVIRTMFWADSARGGKPSDKGKGIQCTATDCDVIKAFTLMEVELVCKVGFILSPSRLCRRMDWFFLSLSPRCRRMDY